MRTATPRRAAARMRSSMSRSVKYAFMTSRRRRAPSICSRIACEAATKPPGITWASAIGVEPGSAGAGKYGARSPGSGPPWPRKLVRNAACACRTTSPVTRTITSWKPPSSKWSSIPAPPVQATAPSTTYELAVVGAADLVLTPVEPLVVRVQPVPVDREDVVDDDLRPGGRQPSEHLLGLAERPRAVTVDEHPNLDAVGQLPLEQSGHRRPDLALPPAEHEDVHRRAGSLDVGEDPGEEVLPLDPRLDRWPRSTRRSRAPRRAAAPRCAPRTPPWRLPRPRTSPLPGEAASSDVV